MTGFMFLQIYRIKIFVIMKYLIIISLILIQSIFNSCSNSNETALKKLNDSISLSKNEFKNNVIQPGAERLADYLPLIKNKKIALVINHTSIVGNTHLLDTLLELGVHVTKVFVPEHGFRGEASAGENITDTKDPKTGIPVISLYGSKYKPSRDDLEDVELVIFDIQDLGVRFYTYISTLGEVMAASAENKIPLIVLDRPNPNGHYVDGPVREERFKSFVAKYPLPVVYGLTIGELATMINGEAWNGRDLKCDLTVIKCINYSHLSHYDLPVKPSPNIPDFIAVSLYPSLCFFEGTTVSLGRGTDMPFKQIGHPLLNNDFKYSFIPSPNRGSTSPPQNGNTCYGINFNDFNITDFRYKGKIELKWLIEFYNLLKDKDKFFLDNNYIDKLAGTESLRKMILSGKNPDEIRQSWMEELAEFKILREKYLLYDDFE